MSNVDLKEICIRAKQRTSKYNLSTDFEIKQVKSIILERTEHLPKGMSVPKRIEAIVTDFKSCTCKECGKFHTKHPLEFCCKRCQCEFKKRQTKQRNDETKLSDIIELQDSKFEGKQEGIDYIICKICGCKVGAIHPHIKTHSISLAEYRERFEGAPIRASNVTDKMSGENNPGYQHGGKYSAWSKNFIHGYDKDKHDKFISDCSERMKNSETVKKTNSFFREFYDNDEDYKKAQTRNLEWFVTKYGEEDGEKKWKAKTEKWMNTMDSKSPDELMDITRRKANISKIEMSLFNTLLESHPDLVSQICIQDDEGKAHVYDIGLGDKIIEFNGDYWHANPLVYAETFVNKSMNKSAPEIWEHDKLRKDVATKSGFKILTIWESDFKNDEQGTVERCLAFLTQ